LIIHLFRKIDKTMFAAGINRLETRTASGFAGCVISILERQCLGRRLMDRATARREVNAWQRLRNAERRGIDWTFTRQDADRKLGCHYVS
jgi:hypothetical protein